MFVHLKCKGGQLYYSVDFVRSYVDGVTTLTYISRDKRFKIKNEACRLNLFSLFVAKLLVN